MRHYGVGFKRRPPFEERLSKARTELTNAQTDLDNARAELGTMRDRLERLFAAVTRMPVAKTNAPPLKPKQKKAAAALIARLSPRELEVLKALAMGDSNAEYAARVGISVKTVDTHRLHMLAKLELKNNIEMARFAVRHGIVSL